ncbi:hypothetical protein XELAEV_18041588mg [Xenopus laevis]|uniref:Sulfotransferase n=1 Tax=Xenopus laevis TaxID=8355 RepID=A0A974C2H4_XENLA|nr:hypothetical protein XELAEV_18041588mg [Xenopus laevis]
MSCTIISGTTWIQEIIGLIMNDGYEDKCNRAPVYERIPFVDILHLMKQPLHAKDTATSFFYVDHMAHLHPIPESWDKSLQRREQKDQHNILYLFYKDLQKNPLQEVCKVVKFLDKEFSEEMLKKIVHLTSFNKMKENPMVNYSTFPSGMLNQTNHKFMRKGKVGDCKNQFTIHQNEVFEADYKQQMSGSTLKFHTAV